MIQFSASMSSRFVSTYLTGNIIDIFNILDNIEQTKDHYTVLITVWSCLAQCKLPQSSHRGFHFLHPSQEQGLEIEKY